MHPATPTVIDAPGMEITRLVPWFGANAANAGEPAKHLKGCTWVYVPFAGSMCELAHFPEGVQLLVSDLHNDLICLASVVMNENSGDELVDRLSRKLFHPAQLEEAREVLRNARCGGEGSLFGGFGGPRVDDVSRAEAYFTVAWMGRSGVSGTRNEDRAGLALRYDAGGGDPVKRWQSAVASLEAWHDVLARCSFTCEDVFDVLGRVAAKVTAPGFNPKLPGNRIGIYLDPPWPDDGEGYLHVFSESQQRRLARQLLDLPHVRICVRFGDHPLIRELYSENVWTWHRVAGRDQHQQAKAEVFLVRGGEA